MAKEKLSPMMQQYLEIKEKYSDCILFFRLGDFYEMFFDDAKTASRELELTLTGKQCGLEERAPMCGVPYHASDTYISRLIDKGYKVAICEQVEDPQTAKGIVKREVIQIVTPGTIISSTMLNEKENNYIASVYIESGVAGLAYCDISTGEIYVTEMAFDENWDSLINELVKIDASEVIMCNATASQLDIDYIRPVTEAYFNIISDEFFRREAASETIKKQFGVTALHGIGLEDDSSSEMSLGSMLLYLMDTQKGSLSHIQQLTAYSVGQHMSLDKSTIKNLELTETLFEKKLQGSLLGVIDKTCTAMGSRKLKQWIREPLNDVKGISRRLDAVEDLLDNIFCRNNIREALKCVYDFQRLAGRIATGKANGRDMIALKNSCAVIPDMKNELLDLYSGNSSLIEAINGRISALTEVHDIINSGIIEDPPFTIKEGGIIKKGYSAELDELKSSISDAQNWIASLENSERERTGIKNLKVGFNKVFGYYIEVTKSYYDMIPDDYIRKQTLVNCERFITPQLKETERLVLNAESQINKMEYDLFNGIRASLQEQIGEIQTTSDAIAELDVLLSFAHVAEKNNYVKPDVDDKDIISIEGGRHPVIEQTIRDGIFVSNDTYVDRQKQSLLIITGPNMAGKSTYMRQTALIVLMAQAGCFVPCDRARIGVCDRIFTRIGASDNLAQGQSTFFVEMSELSHILNTATGRSLVILDEIGRGTSTYDGLSIAWAAAEYLCHKKRHIRTLFATHYHEMTVLEDTLEGVKNFNVDVDEENGDIVFLHKIVQGSASRSYGIHVAKLSGAPKELLDRAQEHLESLQNERQHNLEAFAGEESLNLNTVGSDVGPIVGEAAEYTDLKGNTEKQLTFFDQMPDPVLQKLRGLDLMNITPSQALKILEEIKEKL